MEDNNNDEFDEITGRKRKYSRLSKKKLSPRELDEMFLEEEV